MPAELTVLGLAVLLAVVQLALFAVPANLEIGSRYLAGPRDGEMPPMSATTRRLQRAFQNHIEGLVLFSAAVLVVVAGEASSGTTALAAWAYLAARVAYVPCYWTGVPWIRSAVWAVGL
ncbi:MAG: MAPEG family protein, partial [Pseudomonadota bacterium]